MTGLYFCGRILSSWNKATSKEEEVMSEHQFTTEAGDFLVVWITGHSGLYIVEVTQSDPLQLKVEETGPFAYLKNGDFIIRERESAQLQQDCRDNTETFLEEQLNAGRLVVSGLKKLGVEDNELHSILPSS